MSDETRPAPDWVGDVGLGVEAWVGETPSTLDEQLRARPGAGGDGDGRRGGRAGGRKGKAGKASKGGRGRTRTWEEREAARLVREEAAAAELEADPEAVARKILLDTLTGQARSRQELADKLAKRGVPDELAGGLLERFAERAPARLTGGGRLVWLTPASERTSPALRRAGLTLGFARDVDLGGYEARLERWDRPT